MDIQLSDASQRRAELLGTPGQVWIQELAARVGTDGSHLNSLSTRRFCTSTRLHWSSFESSEAVADDARLILATVV